MVDGRRKWFADDVTDFLLGARNARTGQRH